MTQSAPDFDSIARPYRWLEYCTLGPMLERCRFAHLPRLADVSSALVLGDGDGRFFARLLTSNPQLHATVVDNSAAMLTLCHNRAAASQAQARVTFLQVDIREFSPSLGTTFDLVVTHFFLDCLAEVEIHLLVQRLTPSLAPHARWLVSEFAIPARGPARLFARLLIRALYFAFRILTGLQVQHLPDYTTIFRAHGFTCTSSRVELFGLLRSELWQSGP